MVLRYHNRNDVGRVAASEKASVGTGRVYETLSNPRVRTVCKSTTPPVDFLIGHGSHVEPAPPREDIGSHPRSRGRSTSLKLPWTGEAKRDSSGGHHPAR